MKQQKFALALLVGAVLVGTAVASNRAVASDHDDGVSDLKATNTNLTDLYVFRESSVKGNSPDATDDNRMTLQMLCNPRSIAKQDYFFHTTAQYDFNISKIGATSADNKDKANNTPAKDFVLRFTFGAPVGNNQPITMSALRTGTEVANATTGVLNSAGAATTMQTTSHANATASADKKWDVTVAGAGGNIQVFAGLRQDPFFFDVEQFFKVRAGANTFRNGGANGNAVDAFAGYNALAIVVSVPEAFIRGTADTTTDVYDVWETIQVRK